MLNRLFLPFISPGKPVHIGPCGMNGRAERFAALWLAMLGERAQNMRCDARLVEAAQDHASFLAEDIYGETRVSMHTGRSDSTPNQRVGWTGYKLPDWHGNGNTVESVALVYDEATVALEMLLSSDAHRPHLLGEGFYEASTVYGIGQVGGYWVVLICPPE